ncbi:MAG: right-handed parallel beta-helix repeat-containing protein [Candidatus Hatepunaea meridiana]|nr:right-handed parallel beta-helix repeat-containing protein [Candidatus Hatepunaea meridiana]
MNRIKIHSLIVFLIFTIFLITCTNEESPTSTPVDYLDPKVEWLSPSNGASLSGTVELVFTAYDETGIDLIRIYCNGFPFGEGGHSCPPQNRTIIATDDTTYSMPWNTLDDEDGVYNLEARAWDKSGNMGSTPCVALEVLNQAPPEPRVIWVPDDYETIQDAINASQDGDTVRVRAGTYREGVRIMKRVWLESEEGPELTIIDAEGEEGYGFGIAVAGVRDTISTAIRGFTIRNCGMDGIFLSEGASVRVVNNIILNCERAGIYIYDGLIHAAIVNNVIGHSSPGLYMYISTANISNNILFNMEGTAFFNVYLYENPVVPDYNIAFEYGRITNNPPIHFGDHNIFNQDPLFLENSFRLSEDSPGIDSGNPDLLDPDGSRSDIGAYGGPHAYQIPQ